MTQDEFDKRMGIIIDHTGGEFAKLYYTHCRYLKGDCSAVVVLSYILDLLRMRNSNLYDRRDLKESDMWFKCLAKDIRESLGISDNRQKRAIDVLEAFQLIETDRRAGNALWVRINTDSLAAIGTRKKLKADDTRYVKNDVSESSKFRIGEMTIQNRGNDDSHENRGNDDSLYKKRKKKKNCSQATRRPAGSSPRERMNQIPSILNGNSSHTVSQSRQFAKQLADALTEKGKLMRTPNLDKWELSFSSLIDDLKKDTNRVKIALEFHIKSLGSQFCIKAYSADSFKERFIEIEDQMERQTAASSTKKIAKIRLDDGTVISNECEIW